MWEVWCEVVGVCQGQRCWCQGAAVGEGQWLQGVGLWVCGDEGQEKGQGQAVLGPGCVAVGVGMKGRGSDNVGAVSQGHA